MQKVKVCELCHKWKAILSAIVDGDMLKICYPCARYERDIILVGRSGVSMNYVDLGDTNKINFRDKDLTVMDLIKIKVNGKK